jgi:hypothetical protein
MRRPPPHPDLDSLKTLVRNPTLDSTVTIFQHPGGREKLTPDPSQAVTAYAPPAEDLVALSAGIDFPDSGEMGVPSQPAANRAFAALPPDAPEWMRAARVMADGLERCIARGSIDTLEHAAVERAWYAWTLGGATPRQVLRVAHLVRRAYEAIRVSQRVVSETAVRDCAGVLLNGLPPQVRQTIPFERAVWVVRALREESDPWVAVVEGTAELLGWKDYARVHAAYVIRAVIQQK